jgi:hypothetical protein
MTAQLSPEQVRSLLAGLSSQPAEQEAMADSGPRRVYRVTWDRCSRCKEREQGLCPVVIHGRFPKIEYVCEWCRKELEDEILPEL